MGTSSSTEQDAIVRPNLIFPSLDNEFSFGLANVVVAASSNIVDAWKSAEHMLRSTEQEFA